jgi:hypothetical protein
MAIDDPLDALAKAYEFEDLTASPLRRFARPLARISEVLKWIDPTAKLALGPALADGPEIKAAYGTLPV